MHRQRHDQVLTFLDELVRLDPCATSPRPPRSAHGEGSYCKREDRLHHADGHVSARWSAVSERILCTTGGQNAALPAGETFDLPFESLLKERFVLGRPEDCLRELLQWRDAGGDRARVDGSPVARGDSCP